MKTKRLIRQIPRSLLAFVLMFAMLAQIVAVPAAAQSTAGDGGSAVQQYGDVNGDGTIDSQDVDLLARYLADDQSATINLTFADVDDNGTVDLNDLLYLVKFVKGDQSITLGKTVTVTFETNGGKPIEPVSVVFGGVITAPDAEKENAVFVGWFTDPSLETPFYPSDPILQDMTVYAKYQEVTGSPEATPVAYTLRDETPDLVFMVERISGELLPQDAVKLNSVDGSVAPALSFEAMGENLWKVTAVGGYTEGASYVMSLEDGYQFQGRDASIRKASFFIRKEQVANLTTNEDIIYIQDTPEMYYTLSDGTGCDVLNANVLYNDDDVLTGSFTYTGSTPIQAGDTLCIYVDVHPNQRDYINGNYEKDPTAYIVVKKVSETTVYFRGMSMQGEESDVEKLISLPNTIPFSVHQLPEGDGTVDMAEIDPAAMVVMYNTSAPEGVKVGDYLVFYIGSFGSLTESDTVYYKKVIAVEGTTVRYVESSKDDLLNAINMYLEQGVEGEKMLENIDQEQLKQQVMQQVAETNFAMDAMQYLGDVVACSDEFYDYISVNKIVVYDENGVQLTEEQIKAYGLGKSFELADDVELGFNINTCDPDNSHFGSGIKVELSIGAEFEVDIGKDGKKGSLKIELGAVFTQEVSIDVNVNATADITWILCIPKINDIVFSSAVDVMSYTGVSVEAKFYTQEPSEDFFDKLKENWGDTLGQETLEKLEAFKKKYEDKFGEDSLGEDIEGFWEAQTDLINELIANGEISEEALEDCMESNSENHIVETFFDKAFIMDDDEYGAGIKDLAERYAEMLGEEDNGWLELCKVTIFECPVNLWIFQISIEGSFVVRANVNIALGANIEYEIGKRYVNWFSLFGNGSGAEQIDLIDERFAFQFYAMGHLGLKVGINIEIKVGIISTKIGNVGISAEAGAFADLYGYFQYTYTKTRPAGGKEWEEEESLIGALYFEFGIYVDINVKAELLSMLEKEWEVYSGKWTLLTAGSINNIYGFATEMEAGEKLVLEDDDGDLSNGVLADLPESYRAMSTLDMVSGDQDTPVMPWISYYGYNFWDGDAFSMTNRSDKVNFSYTLSSSYFTLVPVYEERDGQQYLVDYKIHVDVPENVHYLTCELRLVWCLDKLCWSKYDMALTIPIVWTDLTEEELTEFRTATVKIGNETEGYRTVWSERYLKGEVFTLPTEEEILELANYAGEADLRYSGYTGYTANDRGQVIDPEGDQSMVFDTVYYFELTTRTYQITVQDVQNADGTTTSMTFSAKYGEAFNFSALSATGTELENQYTAFYGIEAKNAEGQTTLADTDNVIKGNFAAQLMNGQDTYHAKYVNNGGTVTYKFSGINLAPITKVYKKGTMPTTEDFLAAIRNVEENAIVSGITPTISAVSGDIVYAITVTIPVKPPKEYTISYNTNGGSTLAASVVAERSVMTQPQQPTKPGYSFAGWYYDADLTQPVTWGGFMPAKNFTLYAKWSANSYTIHFNAGEGSANAPAKVVVYNTAVGTLPGATRANYVFVGWYTAANGGTEYTADTTFQNAGDVTLYAHWRIKETIASSDVFIANKTTTYDGNAVTLDLSNTLGLDASSFTLSYKRQNLDSSWSTKLPVNAGIYDVRIQRAEDDVYLACEYTYTAVLTINKASRTLDASQFVVAQNGYTLNVVGLPDNAEGQKLFCLVGGAGTELTEYTTAGGFLIPNMTGEYSLLSIRMKIEESENYLASNVITSNRVSTVVPEKDLRSDYKIYAVTKTVSRTASYSATDDPLYVELVYNYGQGVGYDTQQSMRVSNTAKGATSKDYFSTPMEPWAFSAIGWKLGGNDAWRGYCVELWLEYGGQAYNYWYQTSGDISKDLLFFEKEGESFGWAINDVYRRNIEDVGNFTYAVNLSLTGNDGAYTYTYDGSVADQYKAMIKSGPHYNAYNHCGAPAISLSVDSAYASYFWNSMDSVHIDRDGLYRAMLRDGKTSLTATATLTFDTYTTASGNTWTKTFNISLPSAATVSEGMDAYYISTEGNMDIQAEENKDYLYVSVGLNGNPGIWGMKNTVEYDKDALELLSVVEGNLASQYTMSVNNDTAAGKYTFVAYRDGATESYANGAFATLVFRKKTEQVDLNTAITLTTNQTINDQGEAVAKDDAFNMGDFSSAPPTDENSYVTNANVIIEGLRAAIDNRNTANQTFYYQTRNLITAELLAEWFHTAQESLDSYDAFAVSRYSAAASKYTKNGEYFYTITYKAEYYLTNAQETLLDQKIADILAQLDVSGKTSMEKLLAAYDYVCENVVYDVQADNCFTAYGALVDGEAVCQGYALALMRLLNAMGVQTDVVLGTSNGINHMWNIVKLDGEYFLLDATWDSSEPEACYFWFLKGSDAFADHVPQEDYPIGMSKDDHADSLAVSHAMSASNCNDPATCSKCGYVAGEAGGHVDENRDHICDLGCGETNLGVHADSPDDNNHVCDYGCGAILESCTGANAENGYLCSICGRVDSNISMEAALEQAVAELEAAIAAGNTGLADEITMLNTLLTNAKAALEESDEELADKIETAESTLNLAIQAVQKNLDDAVIALNKAITEGDASLSKQIADLSQALADARAALEQTDATNLDLLTDKIENAESTLNLAIQAVQKNLDDAVIALNKAITEGDASLSKQIADLSQALADARAALEQTDATNLDLLTDMIENAEDTLELAIQAVQKDLNEAKTALQQAINNLQQAMNNGDSTLAQEITALAEALAKAEATLEQADEDTKAELNEKITTANKLREAAIQEIQEKLDEAVRQLNAAISQGDTALDDKITDLNEALTDAQAAMNAADQANKTELEGKITTAESTLKAAIQAVEDKLDSAKKELDQAIVDLILAMNNGDSTLAQEIAALNEALTAAQEAMSAADRANKTELEGKIAGAKSALQTAINAVQKNLDDAKASLEAAIAAGDKELSDRIDGVNAALAAAKAALTAADAANKSELEGKISSAQAALQTAIDAVAKNLADATAELNQAIANGDAALDDKIAELKVSLEAAVAAQAAANAADLQALTIKTEEADAALQAAIDALAGKLADTQDALAGVKEELINAQKELDAKDQQLYTFLIIVSVVAGLALCGSGAFVVWFFADRKKNRK